MGTLATILRHCSAAAFSCSFSSAPSTSDACAAIRSVAASPFGADDDNGTSYVTFEEKIERKGEKQNRAHYLKKIKLKKKLGRGRGFASVLTHLRWINSISLNCARVANRRMCVSWAQVEACVEGSVAPRRLVSRHPEMPS